MLTPFDFSDYKSYLNQKLSEKIASKRGTRTVLARALNCQPGYVSRVLGGGEHFSLEQASLINEFLAHAEDESEFFILLVEEARAGNESLRKFCGRRKKKLLEKYLNLKERFQIKNDLSAEDTTKYFSHWYYAAVHTFLSIPKFQNKELLAKQLHLSNQKVVEIIKFLLSIGIIREENGKYVQGKTRLHLGNDSALISKHHANWRLQALQSLERDTGEELHYSSVVSLSQEDFVKIKSILVKNIDEIKTIIRDSKEEAVVSFCMDFFRL